MAWPLKPLNSASARISVLNKVLSSKVLTWMLTLSDQIKNSKGPFFNEPRMVSSSADANCVNLGPSTGADDELLEEDELALLLDEDELTVLLDALLEAVDELEEEELALLLDDDELAVLLDALLEAVDELEELLELEEEEALEILAFEELGVLLEFPPRTTDEHPMVIEMSKTAKPNPIKRRRRLYSLISMIFPLSCWLS
jgi:hypothetical protein